MTVPRILILHASGTNRDDEARRACQLAGAEADICHIRQLRHMAKPLAGYQALVLPGGFSYGDALGAGALQALALRTWFQDTLLAFVHRDGQILGICNGFQTLVKAGLFECGATARRRLTLTHNQRGRFECRWVYLEVNRDCSATWLHQLQGPVFCPVAHGEGRFRVRDEDTLQQLQIRNQIAFRYVDAQGQPAGSAYPANPNGSVADIAGLASPDGAIVGLMPHPEDHVLPRHSPLPQPSRTMGLRLFEAFVEVLQ